MSASVLSCGGSDSALKSWRHADASFVTPTAVRPRRTEPMPDAFETAWESEWIGAFEEVDDACDGLIGFLPKTDFLT